MRTSTNKIYAYLFLLLIASVFFSPVQAQSDSIRIGESNPPPSKENWNDSKFSIRLRYFLSINKTIVGASTDDNNYSTFSYEDDLNMNRNDYNGLLDFRFHFGKHHYLGLSYYSINRSVNTILEEEIHFRKHDYPANSKIGVHFNASIIRLAYGYSFISNSHFETGAFAGFHVMTFNTGIVLEDQVQGETSTKDNITFTAPLPDAGLFGLYSLNNHWTAGAELGYFYIQYKDLTGRIFDTSLYVQYNLNRHWGFDLGYSYLGVNMNSDKPQLYLDLDWAYNGPFINLTYRFGKKGK